MRPYFYIHYLKIIQQNLYFLRRIGFKVNQSNLLKKKINNFNPI